MPFPIQINDQPVKYCVSCGVFHPFTKEFWYIRNADTQCGRCKYVHQKYRQSERGKSRHTKYHRSAKGKAAEKKTNQKGWDRAMVKSSKATDKQVNRYEEGCYITREYIKNCMRLQQANCFYCKDPMVYGKNINRQTNRNAVTVERVNNNLGHMCCNCVLVHNRCQWVNHPLKKK